MVNKKPSFNKPIHDLHLIKRCFAYLRPYWLYVLAIYGLMLLINVLNVIVPQFIKWIVDQGIYGGDLSILGQAMLALLGLTAIKGVFIFIQGILSEISSQGVAYHLRNAIQHQLTVLSFSFHNQTEAGQILSRTMQDVERIRFLTGRAVLRIIEGSIHLLLTIAVLWWMNPQLALPITLLLPLLLHRAYYFARFFRPLSVKIQEQLGVLTTRLEQNLRGTMVVKAFAQEEAEIERFITENETWFSLSATSARIQAINAPMLDMIANLGTVLILWYGGQLVINQQLSIGELIAFITYLAQLVRPVRLIGRILPVVAMAASSAERVFEILDAPVEITELANATEITEFKGEVCFENVSFAYQVDYPIIQNISFVAKPGQVVALLGMTGSGKSTIINLIARFYDPTSGQISIDGHDIRSLALPALRQQIGFVMQDSILFAATIRENIAFGRPDAPESEIIQAAKDAQAHEFISKMAQGYDTAVGERGITLSGGQKQRLAIARALLTNPHILILDDATASVDTRTEQLIQMALERLMQNRTTFVIAHRLSSVQQADLILMIEDGRIVAKGTHQSLLTSSELYANIHQLQINRR